MDVQGSLFGDEVHEYAVVIVPPQLLAEELNQWRSGLDAFVESSVVSAPWRVEWVLSRMFWNYEADEEVLRRVMKALSGSRSFRMVLKGLTVVKAEGGKKSLLINLKDSDPLLVMAKLLKKELKFRNSVVQIALPVLQGIDLGEREKKHFIKEETFVQREFWCDRVRILKRNVSAEADVYQVVAELPLL